jgi:hypothetical protein
MRISAIQFAITLGDAEANYNAVETYICKGR